MRALQLNEKESMHKPRTNLLSNILFGMATVLLVIGLAIAINSWRINKIADAHAAQLVSRANHVYKPTMPIAVDASSTVPSTVQSPPSILTSYIVAPSLPRYLIIPKLGINARVLSVGVDATGALQTPDNVYDTAWYNKSALPGQPGAMLVDGHISSWTAHGVFYGLNSLLPGDIIKVQRGDGAVYTYRVVETQVYGANNVDMAAAMAPIDPTKPGLNLISCTGQVIAGTNDFNQRIIVFASQE